MKRFGLLPRIVVANLATFNSIFSAFLGFIVPFIIISFIVLGIAKPGQGSGRLLRISTAVAYLSTLVAGFIAFFVASNLLLKLIGGKESVELENPEDFFTRGLI